MKIDDLISGNMGLVYKIASSFYGVEKDDLYQAGVLGILKAYKNYRKEGVTKFSSYAYDYIFGEMYNLAHNKTLKINKNLLKLYKLVEQTRYKLAQKYNRIPSNKDIAVFLELSEKQVEDAIISGNMVMSLDNYENENPYEKIAIKDNTSVDDKILISESMKYLTNDEKEIIKARFYDDLTQSEIAKKLSMTQVMVSRYEKKGLNKMRNYMHM